MPGVNVVTRTAPGASERINPPGGTYFVAGQAERGSATGLELVRSMAEVEQKLGGRVSYGTLYDDLAAFFAEGGTRAYVARTVGAAATSGTLTLNATTGGLATVVLNAESPGAWSSTLTVEVALGIPANTRTVTVRLGGNVVEVYRDVTSPADLVARINGQSNYLTATDSGNVTAAPGNLPAVLAATALSAGNDQRASIVAATYVTALARFGAELGAGAVAIPGQAASAVGAGLIAHAAATRRIALMAPAVNSTPAAAAAEATALRTTTGAEFGGMFYPWVRVPDGAGGVRTISPEGMVAGLRSATMRATGPWQAPAGAAGTTAYVAGVERELTRAEVDTLADARVNPVRLMAGSTRLYGWRSLSLDATNYLALHGRDVLNVIAAEAERLLEPLVFRNIDARGHLAAEAEGTIIGLLEPIRAAGGLYERLDDAGVAIDPGYSVDAGPSVNTNATAAAGEFHIVVAVRVSPIGELITLTITKVALDAAV